MLKCVLAIPKGDSEECQWLRIKPSCFKHKVYPRCKCGRLYVPINKGDKDCFFCNFTEIKREPIKILTSGNYHCKYCNKEVIATHFKRKNPVCYDCKTNRAYLHKDKRLV